SAKRTMFGFIDHSGCRMNRQSLRIANPHCENFFPVAGLTDERIARWCGAVITESKNLAAMTAGILRRRPVVTLSSGHEQRSVSFKRETTSHIAFLTTPGIRDKDLLDAAEPLSIEPPAT